MGMGFKPWSLFGFALAFPLCTQAAPAISLATTVGKASVHCTDPGNPDNCGLPPSNMVSVEPGEPYVVGYNVSNTGDTAFVSHTLTDTVFGVLLNNFSYTLPPSAAAFITQRGNAPLVAGTYPQTATWVATTAGGDTATAPGSVSLTVLPPDFEITTTVAPAIEVCTTRTTSVPAACRPATPSTSSPAARSWSATRSTTRRRSRCRRTPWSTARSASSSTTSPTT